MVKKVKQNKMKSSPLLIVLSTVLTLQLLALNTVSAQSASAKVSPLEGVFYDSGKVYLVVAVAGVILLGIFVYLIRMDRAVSALENEMHKRVES